MSTFIKLIAGVPIVLLAALAVSSGEAAPKVKANIGSFQGGPGANAADLKVNLNLFAQRRTGGPGGEQRQTASPPNRNNSSGPRPQQRK